MEWNTAIDYDMKDDYQIEYGMTSSYDNKDGFMSSTMRFPMI